MIIVGNDDDKVLQVFLKINLAIFSVETVGNEIIP